MKLPKTIPIYGDTTYRGDCPKEMSDQQAFYHWLKFNYPLYGRLFIHPKNEGKKNYRQISKEKSEGSMNPGASDVIIPGCPAFVCELKRKDHTQSKLPNDELEYLETAKDANSFACIALGLNGLKEAFLAWLDSQSSKE